MSLQTKEDIIELLKSIETDKGIAVAEIPGDVLPSNIPIYQITRTRAQERVWENQQIYKDYVSNHIGAIILQGPEEKQLEFAKRAEEEGGTLTYDTNKVYRDMTKNAFFHMGGQGSLTADQIALVFSEIRLLTRTELNIFRLRDPDIDWMMMTSWKDPNEFADGVRDAVFRSNGIKLTETHLLKTIQDSCLEKPIPRTTIPVVVLGVKESELAEFAKLFSYGHVVVDVSKEADVKEVFETLKTTIQTNKTGDKTNG